MFLHNSERTQDFRKSFHLKCRDVFVKKNQLNIIEHDMFRVVIIKYSWQGIRHSPRRQLRDATNVYIHLFGIC